MEDHNQIWLILNRIHELKATIATESVKDYKSLYLELESLEQKIKELHDECD